jgi:hypothetical protein
MKMNTWYDSPCQDLPFSLVYTGLQGGGGVLRYRHTGGVYLYFLYNECANASALL